MNCTLYILLCTIIIFQLSRETNAMKPLSADKIFIMHPLNEEDQKPNPVVERVKLIMIAGLFVVHANRYCIFVLFSVFHNIYEPCFRLK